MSDTDTKLRDVFPLYVEIDGDDYGITIADNGDKLSLGCWVGSNIEGFTLQHDDIMKLYNTIHGHLEHVKAKELRSMSEDEQDLILMRACENEPRTPHAVVKKQLQKEGLLP